jgi:AraC-like DNA-binding protein
MSIQRGKAIVRFFKPQGLPYVQAVHGENVSGEYRRHAHSGFCVGLILKESRVLHSHGTSTVIPENQLFVINPGQAHACKSKDDNHSYIAICMEPKSMAALASQIHERSRAVPHFTTNLIHNKMLALKIREFFTLIESTSTVLERESVLISFLSALIMRYGKNPPLAFDCGSHDRAINDVCEFIRAQYSRDLTLSQLSEIACLSPFYLQRLFLKKTGFSPKEYLVHCRMKKARELLMQGNAIASVALETGFVDQSHFTRYFKRLVGITPGEYVFAASN